MTGVYRPALLRAQSFERIIARTLSVGACEFNVLPLTQLAHSSRITHAQLGPVEAALISAPSSLMNITVPDAQSLMLMPAANAANWVVNGSRIAAPGLMMVSGGNTINLRTDDEARFAVLLFDRARYGWLNPAAQMTILNPADDALRALRSCVHGIFHMLDDADLGGNGMSIFRLDDSINAIAAQGAPTEVSNSDPMKTMRAVDDFVTQNYANAIYLYEVASAVSKSARTVHNAVVATRGMSFIRYLRLRRLWSMYQILLEGPPTQIIKTIALEHGFWHFGDLSKYYAGQFGESPSVTRKVSLQSSAQTILKGFVEPGFQF